MTIQKLGTLVFDTIGELCHRGETRLDPDSAEAIELRKMAYRAVGVKTDGDPHWYRAGNSATRCWNGSRAWRLPRCSSRIPGVRGEQNQLRRPLASTGAAILEAAVRVSASGTASRLTRTAGRGLTPAVDAPLPAHCGKPDLLTVGRIGPRQRRDAKANGDSTDS
jgi:hypothetical protein